MKVNEKSKNQTGLRSPHTFKFQPSCSICKYWSGLIAQATIGEPVEALCLATKDVLGDKEGPFARRFTTKGQYCEFCSAGPPIDTI